MFNYLLVWLVVLAGDSIVFTFGYTIIFRILFKRFWWQKEYKKPYEIKIEPDGISINLQNNPFDSLKKLYNDITGQNKTIDERIDDAINGYIDDSIVDKIVHSKDMDNIDEQINKLIKKRIDKKIGERNGEISKKEN